MARLDREVWEALKGYSGTYGRPRLSDIDEGHQCTNCGACGKFGDTETSPPEIPDVPIIERRKDGLALRRKDKFLVYFKNNGEVLVKDKVVVKSKKLVKEIVKFFNDLVESDME